MTEKENSRNIYYNTRYGGLQAVLVNIINFKTRTTFYPQLNYELVYFAVSDIA